MSFKETPEINPLMNIESSNTKDDINFDNDLSDSKQEEISGNYEQETAIDRSQKESIFTLKKAIKNGRDIGEYLELATEETLQIALKQGLRERINSGESISKFIPLVTDETLEKIKQNQKIIETGLFEVIKNGMDIGEYLELATEETLQIALKQGLAERISKKQDVDKYLDLANEETLMGASVQELTQLIISGEDISEYLKSITEEAKEYLLSDTEKLKECLFESSLYFFRQDFKSEIEKHLKSVIESYSREQVWDALFDHTTLPVGIKFHVPNDTPLSKILNKTGGFVAHGEEQCYVANPLHNQTLLKTVFESMNRYLKESDFSLENINYIQTCCLGRLPNKESGIATFSFLMAKSRKEQLDSKTLIHRQNIFGVTIPDGGRVREDNIVPNENLAFSNMKVNARTDMLFCRDEEEVFLANDLLTLLNHSYMESDTPMLFKKLGGDFAKDVTSLIRQYDLLQAFNETTFIGTRSQNIPKLLEFIEKIKESRLESEELLEKIKKANNFVLGSDNEEEIERVRTSYEILVKEYQETLPYKLSNLVERYRERMRPEGLTRQVVEDQWDNNNI